MPRLLASLAASLILAGAARAQCLPWYPPYPVAPPVYPYYGPALWGAPAPKPLPPALPPYKPKAIPAIREEGEPDAQPARPPEKSKNGTRGAGDEKEKDPPRIPKTRLIPGDPLDKGVPEVPKKDVPRADTARKDAAPDKAVEQFVIPSDGRGEPKAEVRVGFFNHTERDVVLDVNGQALRLPKQQYVTVRLPRTFVWAEKGARGTSVVVPPDADGMEIVFRK